MKEIATVLLITLLNTALKAGYPDLRVANLNGYWKFSIGDNMEWARPDYDDSGWEQVYVPSPWENEGFNGFDGYGWYRIDVMLNIPEATDYYYLELGYIDDVDEVYFNGTLIGFNGSFPPEFRTAYTSHRRYYIPRELIRKGENTIAVRVYDTVLDGGIIKGDVGIFKKKDQPEKLFVLEGVWKFREGNNPEWKEKAYDDSCWKVAIVPGSWKSYKKFHLETGFAWYRKTFELPSNLKNEKELVIVLGKIDDFDKVYLNGHLIGFTKDNLPYGYSHSFEQYRIYGLTEKYLNRNGQNVIAIQVEDMGGDAGIYQGPLAIVPYRDYNRLIDDY